MNEWNEGGLDEAAELSARHGRALHVGDGVLGHVRALSPKEAVWAALLDYARDYDAGGASAVEVFWRYYENREQREDGS